MIIVDSSGLLALFNRAEPAHQAVAALVESSPDPLVVSPFVAAELDYLVTTRHGVDAELAVLTIWPAAPGPSLTSKKPT